MDPKEILFKQNSVSNPEKVFEKETEARNKRAKEKEELEKQRIDSRPYSDPKNFPSVAQQKQSPGVYSHVCTNCGWETKI